MRIPARLALEVEPFHCLVARKEVLEGAREDVVRGGLAVGRGRALIEDEAGLARARLQRFLEGALLLPAGHQLLLQVGEADLLIYFFEHLARRRSGCAGRRSRSRRPASRPAARGPSLTWAAAGSRPAQGSTPSRCRQIGKH